MSHLRLAIADATCHAGIVKSTFAIVALLDMQDLIGLPTITFVEHAKRNCHNHDHHELSLL